MPSFFERGSEERVDVALDTLADAGTTAGNDGSWRNFGGDGGVTIAKEKEGVHGSGGSSD